ncbi:MAG: SDR family NAD(P)-dependent oxidoreductase [Pirellulaceae bacterium]
MSDFIDLPGIDQFRLDGRTAMLTGGSKGLGLAIAFGLASAGAQVMLVSRQADTAATAAAAIEQHYGATALSFGADVTEPHAMEAAVGAAMAAWGKVDILVNSAGINIRGPIDELTPEQFDDVIKTNVHGTWNACRAVVPHMKQAGYGRIINLASTLGVVGLANRTPTPTAKGPWSK